MNFIGRKEELNTLEKEFHRDGSFVVIYGRRRIGKTTLIKEFIKDKQAFYFLATEEVESQSMKRLAGVVARVTGNSMLQRVAFTDWLDLFREIANYRPEEKKVLVIDEFPYLVKTNAAFPSILQNAWDEILKDSNVMLILCGSLISMMQKHALSHDSPLYGRRSAQIRLKPLPFTDLYAVQGQPFSHAVEQYSVTGGVPKYLEFFEPGEDLYRQIQEVVLSKNGFLYEEPNFLLKEELTPYLSTLIDLDFLKKATPVTEKNPEKSRKGLYFISDNFIRFWFRYVYPYKGELELDNQQIVLDELEKDFIQKFVAFSYEDICKDIFASLCRSKAVDFAPSRIGSYWLNDINGDTEIDVMAVDHQKKQVFAGECKYHNKPVDATVYYELEEKVKKSAELRTAFPGYKVLYGLFSKSGFTQRMLDQAEGRDDILLIQEDCVL